MAKEKKHEPEDRARENIQIKVQREKKMENIGKNIFFKPYRTVKICSNICITGVPGEKRKDGIKAIFEKTIDNNFQN